MDPKSLEDGKPKDSGDGDEGALVAQATAAAAAQKEAESKKEIPDSESVARLLKEEEGDPSRALKNIYILPDSPEAQPKADNHLKTMHRARCTSNCCACTSSRRSANN